MKTRTKVALTVLCALLLVTVSILGTLAYLTSETETVTNTFTVGNVKITLDEAPVDADGKITSGARVKENSYKLLPGHKYDKDPTIHVDANSEKCYLFVEITDEIAAIQDAETVAAQMAANGWTLLDGNVFYYESTATAGQDVKVFENFKVKGNVENTDLAAYAGKTIKVTAYAVQADGFDTAAEAWGATFGA